MSDSKGTQFMPKRMAGFYWIIWPWGGGKFPMVAEWDGGSWRWTAGKFINVDLKHVTVLSDLLKPPDAINANSDREAGFYWIRSRIDAPVVARWSGQRWRYAGYEAEDCPEDVTVLSARLVPPMSDSEPTHSVQRGK